MIEYIRYALDRARREDFAGDRSEELCNYIDEFLKLKPFRDFGDTKGTLIPGFEIEIDLVVAERKYRVRRTDHGRPEVIQDPGTSSEEKVPFEVRSLITPRIISQGQIASIAKDPASQRNELDALIDRDQLAQNEQRRRGAVERIRQLQVKRLRIKERQKDLPARETELQMVRDQIAFLERAGGRETLSRFQLFEKERQWLDAVLKELEEQAFLISQQADAAESRARSLLQVPLEFPSSSWLKEVFTHVENHLKQAAKASRIEASSLQKLAEAIRKEKEISWQLNYDSAKKEYEKMRKEMETRGVDFSHHERLLQQRANLERELVDLKSKAKELDQVEQEIRRERERLISLHEERLALRRQQAKALEELDADIRIEILPFRDRDDFAKRREEWFWGTGMQERDWSVLVDYVFGGNGSVPDRIADLLGALRTDIEATEKRGRALDAAASALVKLLGGDANARLTGHFFRSLERRDRIRLDELERFLPEDSVDAKVRDLRGNFKPITTGSVGERSTAILSLLLSTGKEPLIIDQPEADLDNRYIYDVVVSLLRQRKFLRQIIVATHNANIPVNGDAELIVTLGVENRMGKLLGSGSIDRSEIKELVSVIMEGSAEAFRLRKERYGY